MQSKNNQNITPLLNAQTVDLTAQVVSESADTQTAVGDAQAAILAQVVSESADTQTAVNESATLTQSIVKAASTVPEVNNMIGAINSGVGGAGVFFTATISADVMTTVFSYTGAGRIHALRLTQMLDVEIWINGIKAFEVAGDGSSSSVIYLVDRTARTWLDEINFTQSIEVKARRNTATSTLIAAWGVYTK